MSFDLPRCLVAETPGIGLPVATVVGSDIMAQRMTDEVALALLGNTDAILVVLITILGPVSGTHFNPAVTLGSALHRELAANATVACAVAQVADSIVGTLPAHAMFELPLLQASQTVRTGSGQWIAEALAAFGLVFAILVGGRFRPDAVPSPVVSSL